MSICHIFVNQGIYKVLVEFATILKFGKRVKIDCSNNMKSPKTEHLTRHKSFVPTYITKSEYIEYVWYNEQ